VLKYVTLCLIASPAFQPGMRKRKAEVWKRLIFSEAQSKKNYSFRFHLF